MPSSTSRRALGPSVDSGSGSHEARRLAALLLGVFSGTLLAVALVTAQAFDLHTFWVAGDRFLNGAHLYPEPSQLRAFSPSSQQNFIYPAPMGAVFAPLSLLPYGLAKPLFLALLVVAVAGALRLVGVRDWRCYAAAFASPAVLSAISVGTISPILLLALALVWRWRDRPWACGVATALAIVAKLFLWPLLIWLVFSGRKRTGVIAGATALVLCTAAWMRLGFHGLGSYPELLRRTSAIEGRHGDGALWAFGGLRLYELAVPVAAVLVAVAARRLSSERSFAVAVAAALLATPILWLHYLALLPVVAAVAAPTLSALWLAPLVLWLPLLSGAHALSTAGIAALVVAYALPVSSRRLREPQPLPAPAG
jgi:glycosyl transferase family 87